METEEQKKKVTSFFDESKDWQGGLYHTEDTYFARVIRRRKLYAFEMLRKLPDLQPGKALDVGFGSGVYIEELLKMGFECSGTDIAPEMIETIKKRLNGNASAGKVHLLIGDVEHLPFKDAEFDLVLCIGVLGYLLSDEKALRELKRVVRPGGYLLINLTNTYSLSDIDYVWRKKLRSLLRGNSNAAPEDDHPDYAVPSPWMMKNRKFHFKSYNVWKYRRLVENPNFTCVDAMTYGFEFRLLRRIKVVPERILFAAELFLEKFFRKFTVPYFSYSGWVYTGIFKRLS